MEIILQKISAEELQLYIMLAFNNDEELKDYHVVPGTFKEMSKHTYNSIIDNGKGIDIEYYKILLRDNGKIKAIGFSVICRKPMRMLLSLGVNVKFRTKEILIEWLSKLEELFGDKYGVGLWKQNTRAIEFFKKNGFVNNKEDDSKKMVVLWQ